MRSLRTQLTLTTALVVLVAVACLTFFASGLITRRFERYILAQQNVRMAHIGENMAQFYDADTDAWDLSAIHALSMYSLSDGYILQIADTSGEIIWDVETHDMALCRQTMANITGRMATHGRSGAFTSQVHDLRQGDTLVGTLAIKSYGPLFFSEGEFTFMGAMYAILLAIGGLSLLASFLVGFRLSRRLVRPILKTADIAASIAKGRYGIHFEGRTKTRELHLLICAINDLSSALSRQEHLRRQLTSDVAHELRTPLSTLSAHVEAMMEGVWQPTPQRLKSCHEDILRLTALVADLEKLERLERGDMPLTKAPGDLLSLARAIADRFAGEIAAKTQRLSIAGREAILPMDRDKMEGVLANLLSNAIKYTQRGGHIAIHVEDGPNTCRLTIADSGPGIPPKELPHIFERLYRADPSRNRDTGGAGIGLAIAKSSVLAHGGTILAENRKEGGARFTVTLPKKGE